MAGDRTLTSLPRAKNRAPQGEAGRRPCDGSWWGPGRPEATSQQVRWTGAQPAVTEEAGQSFLQTPGQTAESSLAREGGRSHLLELFWVREGRELHSLFSTTADTPALVSLKMP